MKNSTVPMGVVRWLPSGALGAWGLCLTSSCVVVIVASVLAVQAVADDSNQGHVFATEILPLLRAKCFGCHGEGDELRGALLLTSREHLMRGGESGEPAVVPGDPTAGTLVAAIRWDGLEMPPKESERLTPDEIDRIENWISAGAPWPEAAAIEVMQQRHAMALDAAGRVRVKTSGGTSDDWTDRRYDPEDLWAFRGVRPRAELIPAEGLLENAIDFFIDRKLVEAGLVASPAASPQELIVRASYDLTGLPPSAAEVESFATASARAPEEAYRELIERFLASPRYGEHWARHWLDITRYADTGGMSNDYERSNMWRYRDYVIRAFNDDKPYDVFIREQLAGDEMAEASARSRCESEGLSGDAIDKAIRELEESGGYTEQEAEWLVATGFLRLGPWDNAMVEDDEARQIYLDDLVNITGQAFLSQTLRCCKCHDHKFDPIPTRDYYRLYSAFATTFPAERAARFLSRESRDRFDDGRRFVQQMLTFARTEKDKLLDKREQAARDWYSSHNLPYKPDAERRNDPDEMKPPRHVGLNHVESGQLKVREQDEWIWERRLERFEPMVQSVYTSASLPRKFTGARKLRIARAVARPADRIQAYILSGGALTAAGEPVGPGVLSSLPVAVNSEAEDAYLLSDEAFGRRSAVARWITDPQNPLTTRSIVNRLWQFHFGQGIAANSNNFGAKGGRPTHPDLLDYLAGRLVESGWRLKLLHREIMLSRAYRRSSLPVDRESLVTVDPDNRLLSVFRRRRLTAEEIRDSLLSVTGELIHGNGGLPVFPEVNMEVALQPRMIQFSIAPAYQPSITPEERNRRTVYAYHCRGQADPFLELFNQPNPNESCEVRDAASVTPQALTLLNSQFTIDRAVALALQIARANEPEEGAIEQAFRRVLRRQPTAVERHRLIAFMRDVAGAENRAMEPVYPAQITRSLVEEFTGKAFDYEEILPVFRRYQPDRKISSLEPLQRGLAEACLLLMNTNEFLFVN